MSTTKDLGTYHVRVELMDGRGWIQEWRTGYRYSAGNSDFSPLTATEMQPIWTDDEDVITQIEYMYTDGNYGCDCNKLLFIGYAEQKDYGDTLCADKLEIKRLIVIRPDRTQVILIDRAAKDT
jgi:hypothetical protein